MRSQTLHTKAGIALRCDGSAVLSRSLTDLRRGEPPGYSAYFREMLEKLYFAVRCVPLKMAQGSDGRDAV